MKTIKQELLNAGFAVEELSDHMIEVFLTNRKVSQTEVKISIELFDTALLSFYHTQVGVLVVL